MPPRVEVSLDLTESPSALLQSSWGMSPQMERFMKSQQQGSPMGDMGMGSGAILEINPEHPMVQTLARLNTEGQPGLEPFARLLLDHAQIAEGRVADPAGFAGRLQALMEKAASSF